MSILQFFRILWARRWIIAALTVSLRNPSTGTTCGRSRQQRIGGATLFFDSWTGLVRILVVGVCAYGALICFYGSQATVLW